MKEKIKVVIPLSGGKDSQCCLKIALNEFDPRQVRGFFCDTQFEHPKTYAHIDYIEREYGVSIDRVTAGSVDEKVMKYKRFPGGGARHCTDELKIIPSKKYYTELAKRQGGFMVYYGMRSEESAERESRYYGKTSDELYPPKEVIGKYTKTLFRLGVTFKLPIIDWSTNEVFRFLEGKHNPLYNEGFGRVGCFPCLASGDAWKKKAFEHDDFGRSQRIRVLNLEDLIEKSVYTSTKAKNKYENDKTHDDIFDNPGCGVCSI